MKQYRQGHIMLVPLAPIAMVPADAVKLEPGATFGTSGVVRDGEVVLATGETGREHIFKSANVSIFQSGSHIYIEVRGGNTIELAAVDPITLDHPEHADIEIEPGIYRLIEQREMDIDLSMPRRSYD